MTAWELAIVLTLVMLALAAAWACVASGLRLLRQDGRLRLLDAVKARGLALPEQFTPAAARALGSATRRCLTCAEHARCDELLEQGASNTLREICPNSAYLDSLERR